MLFRSQKKLSQRQARWQEFLAEYDFVWEHKPGSHNQVTDALSRREVIAIVLAIVQVESDMLDRLCQAAVEVLVGARPTLCKEGSNLCAEGRAAKILNDGDS